jgi:predicted unusual protein kinase regulating ubiquinone biosynthesis (AarF/ABC1/UbiB family)
MAAGVAASAAGFVAKRAFLSDEAAEAARAATELDAAKQMVRTLGTMKGAAMKLGQMLGADPSLLPPTMRAELQSLQSQAPPMSFDIVKQVLVAELGAPIDEVFESIDEQVLGAASIGQVHRARLRARFASKGLSRDVAVKVQYPGIADTMREDIKTLSSLMNIMRLHVPRERIDSYAREVETTLLRESDYEAEAHELQNLHDVCQADERLRARVLVPRPHACSTKRMLVMEHLSGTSMNQWMAQATPAERGLQGQALLHVYLSLLHEHGLLLADPHPGNFLMLSDVGKDGLPKLGLLDAGCIKHYPLTFTDDLVRIMTSMWRVDVPTLQATWRRLGFLDEGVDVDDAYEWLQFILVALIEDREFEFATWQVNEEALRFMRDHPSLKRWAPPHEVLFYLRTLAGLRGLMMQAGLVMNAHRLAKDVAVRRGLWP